jgi:hypothetical protein
MLYGGFYGLYKVHTQERSDNIPIVIGCRPTVSVTHYNHDLLYDDN